jgi:methionine-S-sulfoxide reductase
VVRTRVGYAGGTLESPTYHHLGDHTETTEIDFDPSKITYGQLLDVFWKTHNPCARAYSRQYMSAIFVHDAAQRKAAEETLKREEAERGSKIQTAILPYTKFWLAEDYHQKYELRNSPIGKEYAAIYPDLAGFVNSTATTRANAYVGGHGTAAQIEADLPKLGLSPEGQRFLRASR